MFEQRLLSAIEKLNSEIENAKKIDNEKHGWKAAVARIRKSVFEVSKELGNLRKEVQQKKNDAKTNS